MSLVEEVKALRLENSEKEKRIFSLENRVDELEQYTRINNIIITGLETKPRSYARAATRMTAGGDTSEEDATSVELQVTAFLNSKGIEIDSDNIEACHLLPRRHTTDKLAKIIRFANRKQKTELLKQGRRLKGSDVYMNEHLTKINAEIARKARFLRTAKNTINMDCKLQNLHQV